MLFNKRGEAKEKPPGAGPAAVLVGIILLIFVFYVVLVPPEERARILGEENDSVNGVIESKNVLLHEQIGRLGAVEDDEVTHTLPNIQLFESAEAQVLASFSPFDISGGVFSTEPKEVRFALNPDQVENVILSFQAPVRDGTLKITLNGLDLYEAQVNEETPTPLRISADMLREENTLLFEVDGPLFTSKKFSFEDVKIIGDVLDPESQRSVNTFVLASEEYNNLDRARLSFFLECQQDDIGLMNIQLNGKRIYSAFPVCDGLNQIDLFKEDFTRDRNTLEFELGAGGALIDTIRLETMLEPTKPFIGFFNVDDDLFADVDRGSRDIILTIDFVDDGKSKEAELNINGVVSVIDQEEADFSKDLSSLITEGNNYVQLTPLDELNIVDLTVEYR